MQPGKQQQTVNISNRTIVRAILWVAAAVVLFKIIGHAGHALTLIFASFFLALALNPIVSWMSRHLKISSRVKATAAAYITVVVSLVAFFTLITPPLVKQTRDFIRDVPQIVADFQNQDSSLARAAQRYDLDEKLTQGAKDFATHYSDFGGTIFNTGKRIANIFVSILVVIVMTFMMLVEGSTWLKHLWSIVPANKRAHHQKIAYKMYKGVTGFVNGQVILAVVAGFFAFFALVIAGHVLDVPINALAMAGIVSVFGLIPLFGNPISSTLVILVSLSSSATLAFVMLIYFLVYYFIENHTFQPIIQSRLNNLTPLTVFVAAILGVGFGGILGAIVAIPAASAVKILVEDYFERRNDQDALTKKTSS